MASGKQASVPQRDLQDERSNPVEGGDVSFVPVNMIPSHMAGMNFEGCIRGEGYTAKI